GDRRDICVVGDASQTIYSFAGADQRFLLEFGHRYPDATVIRLETNYRSRPPILAVANALMRGRPGALELVAAASPAAVPPADPSPAGPPLAASPPEPPTVTAYETERDEAE